MTQCSERIFTGYTITGSETYLSLGVRMQFEPCGSPASATVSYQIDGTWKEAGSIKADGVPLNFGVPGASIDVPLLGSAGLFIAVSLSGNVAALTVQAHLSTCIDESCDGELSSVLSSVGFPYLLLEGNDIGLSGACPAQAESSSTPIVMGGAAAGGIAILAALAFFLQKQRATRPSSAPIIKSVDVKSNDTQMTPSKAIEI